MPTQHVQPVSGEQLQDVANALFKARKVVVVTGAGISTNSGIPDFRSENGLYSLIQAQFDAAARLKLTSGTTTRSDTDTEEDDERGNVLQKTEIQSTESRPSKRRKISRETSAEREPSPERVIEVREEIEVRVNTTITVKTEPQQLDLPEPELPYTVEADEIVVRPVLPDKQCYNTPQPRRLLAPEQLTTSPLSSPPAEAFLNPPSAFRNPAHARLVDAALQLSSSPLSSPPPVLFDPFNSSSPLGSPTRRSSTSATDVDEDEDEPILSQTSMSGRTLPNMKGKDLFDASIWADPLRTSVFYTFATSLRQKIRDVKPTTSHRFISHLRDRGKLVRCYTQNIDQIEEKVGLSTSLKDGPGQKGRFSRRSTANTAQLSKMVDEASRNGNDASSSTDTASQPTIESSQQTDASSSENPTGDTGDHAQVPSSQPARKSPPPRSGVECVFLHGSLDLLRCFLCGRVCSWDDSERESETMSGQQPECPHCVGATVAREERGKRALGVGKLRPDIVLYGEEHPNAHLISPIITHDLSLYPDMLLILGTSLRVHGLKVMVREFAKAVHSKGGNVVFVNFTKPPESTWGDVIDYWIEWDCDAWVDDLQSRIPKLWQEPEPPRPRKKRESGNNSQEDGEKQEKKRPPAANPVAMRDTKATGAYWTLKIVDRLHQLTGEEQSQDRRASLPALPASSSASSIDVAVDHVQKAVKGKTKRPRKSAPGALERDKKPSTLNPNHGRSRKPGLKETPVPLPTPVRPSTTAATAVLATPPGQMTTLPDAQSIIEDADSIISSVKLKPRVRKRKKIDGQEVEMPKVVSRRSSSNSFKLTKEDLTLAPMAPQPPALLSSPFGRPPQPIEPRSPPSGPLTSISANIQSARVFNRPHVFYVEDPLTKGDVARNVVYQQHYQQQQYQFQHWQASTHLQRQSQSSSQSQKAGKGKAPARKTRRSAKHVATGVENQDTAAAMALAGLSSSPVIHRKQGQSQGAVEGLTNWGSSWNCKQ